MFNQIAHEVGDFKSKKPPEQDFNVYLKCVSTANLEVFLSDTAEDDEEQN